jgi:hypothetical protein
MIFAMRDSEQKKIMVKFCLKYFLKIGVKAPLLKIDSHEKKCFIFLSTGGSKFNFDQS